MSVFLVYRKGQKDGISVKADAVKETEKTLEFTTGNDLVASFPLVEVQGWQKTINSTKSGAAGYKSAD